MPSERFPRDAAVRYPYGRHLFDRREHAAAAAALRRPRLSGGAITARFERAFARAVDAPVACFVNSGSSANLLAAVSLLAEHRDGGLRPGDEVIVPALSFPTTINAFLQAGLSVALADTSPATLTLDPASVDGAFGRRTRALSLLHTLGNPCELGELLPLARRRGLFVVEDACEALGARWRGRSVGSFGDAGTFSFYPAHQITTGEGGCVVGADPRLLPVLHSLRDWGRICRCARCDASAPLRVPDGLPRDWNPHFLYSRVGYNLKPLELQAAVGLIQLRKLARFRRARARNYSRLRAWFAQRDDLFSTPRTPDGGEPCWFAFPVLLRPGGIERDALLAYLERHGVETRPLLAGNAALQPAYRGARLRVAGELGGTHFLLRHAFFFGLHPGFDASAIDAIVRLFDAFLARRRSRNREGPRQAPAISSRRATSREATRSKA